MTSSRALGAFLGMALVLLSHALAASPADLFGVGVRPQGMAQTGAAQGEHDHQSYTNPALLGGRDEQHLSFGYQSVAFETTYQGSTRERDDDMVSSTALGVTLPLPFGGALERRFALGLSVLSPRKLITRAALWFPERPQFPLLTSQAQSLSLATGIGVELHPRLRVGAAVRWLASLVGTVLVTGADDETTTVVNDELVTSRSAVVGIATEPVDGVHLGVVWRDAQVSELDVVIRVSELGALTLPEMHLAGTAQYDPEQVDAELSLDEGAWQLVFATRYRRWSAFPGFLKQTVRCPPDEQRCGSVAPPDPNFSDTWAPRAALAYRLGLTASASAEIRLGASYEPSPMPEQTGSANTWDNARVVGTLGYGLAFELASVPLTLDLAFARHWFRERSHTKSAQAAALQPGLARVKTGGRIQLVALALGVSF